MTIIQFIIFNIFITLNQYKLLYYYNISTTFSIVFSNLVEFLQLWKWIQIHQVYHLIKKYNNNNKGYQKLRSTPWLFSILRSTEPFLDEYFGTVANNLPWYLQGVGFGTVRVSAATGRHFAMVAIKSGVYDGSSYCNIVVVFHWFYLFLNSYRYYFKPNYMYYISSLILLCFIW